MLTDLQTIWSACISLQALCTLHQHNHLAPTKQSRLSFQVTDLPGFGPEKVGSLGARFGLTADCSKEERSALAALLQCKGAVDQMTMCSISGSDVLQLCCQGRAQPMRATFCSRAALGCQDARLWPSPGASVVAGTCGGLCGCPLRAFGRLRSGWPAGRQSQRRPAARALLRALAARDGEAGEPPLAYPGSQSARPPTLAGRGEAALYRRAAQEHPRYTQHNPLLLPGTEGQQGGPAPSGRAGGLSAALPDAALQQLAAPQVGERRHALVHFCCHYRAEYGQRLRMVGSHANLGAPPVLAKWFIFSAPTCNLLHACNTCCCCRQ